MTFERSQSTAMDSTIALDLARVRGIRWHDRGLHATVEVLVDGRWADAGDFPTSSLALARHDALMAEWRGDDGS